MYIVIRFYLTLNILIRTGVNVNRYMKVTISVTHRVSDGAEAAQFMQALAGFLENPVRMLV